MSIQRSKRNCCAEQWPQCIAMACTKCLDWTYPALRTAIRSSVNFYSRKYPCRGLVDFSDFPRQNDIPRVTRRACVFWAYEILTVLSQRSTVFRGCSCSFTENHTKVGNKLVYICYLITCQYHPSNSNVEFIKNNLSSQNVKRFKSIMINILYLYIEFWKRDVFTLCKKCGHF